MKRSLQEFGLELEMVRLTAGSVMIGETVGEAERKGKGAFFVVQIDRTNGQSIRHPGEDVRIESKDVIVLVVRGNRISAGAIFSEPKGSIRAGRMAFR